MLRQLLGKLLHLAADIMEQIQNRRLAFFKGYTDFVISSSVGSWKFMGLNLNYKANYFNYFFGLSSYQKGSLWLRYQNSEDDCNSSGFELARLSYLRIGTLC